MSEYESNVDLAEVARMVIGAKHPAITTHAKPDGDAFGSAVALAQVLKSNGADVHTFFIPPVPAHISALDGADLASVHDGSPLPDETDLLIIVDTGAWSQLAPAQPQMEGHLEHTLIIDHHIRGDVDAKWKYIDHGAAASCEIMAILLEETGQILSVDPFADPVVRDALFVGIAADTGWFRFSNTTPRTHEWAARLIREGVDHSALYGKIQQSERPEKLALMIRALDSLKMHADKRAAVMVLRAEDFAETGALAEETERFVDVPQMVSTVQIVVMITEPPENGGDGTGRVGLSFRSKPGPDAVNVSDLAAQFGGGGHARAAGAKLDAPIDEVISRVEQAIAAAFEQHV